MQDFSNLLMTKLHKPPFTQEHEVRSRLINMIENNFYKPVTLITESAGYGKSMLISLALDKIGLSDAWISLDKEDNDLRLFLKF